MEYHVMRFMYMPTTSHIFGHRERWYCCGSVGCIETLEEWFRGAKRSTMTSMHGLEETDGGMFKQVCGQERIVPLDTYLRQHSPCTSYGDMSMCNNICTRVTLGLWAMISRIEEITVLSTRCHERGDRWLYQISDRGLVPNFRSFVINNGSWHRLSGHRLLYPVIEEWDNPAILLARDWSQMY